MSSKVTQLYVYIFQINKKLSFEKLTIQLRIEGLINKGGKEKTAKNEYFPKLLSCEAFWSGPHILTLLSNQVAAAAAKSLQSCPILCDPIDGSLPGSPIPGILQARVLEWVAISFQCMKVKSESEVAQQCPSSSNPMDCSLPGSSIHGIFQARVLEWGTIAFSVCGN